MMAAKIPAVKRPLSTGPANCFTKKGRTAFGFAATGGGMEIRSLVAHAPIKTHGTQTIAINNGCAKTGSLKLSALRAVSQCWKR